MVFCYLLELVTREKVTTAVTHVSYAQYIAHDHCYRGCCAQASRFWVSARVGHHLAICRDDRRSKHLGRGHFVAIGDRKPQPSRLGRGAAILSSRVDLSYQRSFSVTIRRGRTSHARRTSPAASPHTVRDHVNANPVSELIRSIG